MSPVSRTLFVLTCLFYSAGWRMARSIARNCRRVNLGLDVRPLTSPPVCEALS